MLLAGPYLIVITRREKVGEVDQRPIWKVTGTEVISYQRALLHLNEQQVLTGVMVTRCVYGNVNDILICLFYAVSSSHF